MSCLSDKTKQKVISKDPFQLRVREASALGAFNGFVVLPILVIVYEDCDFNCTEVENPKNRNSTNLIKVVLLNNSLFIVIIVYVYIFYSNFSINLANITLNQALLLIIIIFSIIRLLISLL